jgi:hypothetical protein
MPSNLLHLPPLVPVAVHGPATIELVDSVSEDAQGLAAEGVELILGLPRGISIAVSIPISVATRRRHGFKEAANPRGCGGKHLIRWLAAQVLIERRRAGHIETLVK